MLKNVRTTYFYKNLFSFLDEARKLKIVKYNKTIQKSIDINILNYIFYSKRNLIIEEQGKAKEYNIYEYNNTIVYEGDYVNNQRSGKGKEFNVFNKKLMFEGEYLNGKRNGKGKEFLTDGRLLFEGEYLNGRKWNGKGYDITDKNNTYELKKGKGFLKEFGFFDSELIYEGEFFNGQRNGKGKEHFFHGELIFEGEYLNGRRWNGKGYNGKGDLIYELNDGKEFGKRI